MAVTSSTATTSEEIIVIEEDGGFEDIVVVEDGDDEIVVDPGTDDTPSPFDVRARASTALDLRFSLDTSFDRAGEQIADFALGGSLVLDVDFAPTLTGYAQPRFTYVAALEREGDDRSLLYFLTPEAWVRWASGPFSLRAGAMTWSWGSSDFVAPIDVLNPVDFRQGARSLASTQKIPVVGAEAVGTFGPLTVRGVVAPFFQASRFHLTSWDFSVLSGGPLAAIPPSSLEAALSEAYLDNNGDEILLIDRPSQRLDNATLAGRATFVTGDLDVSMSLVHGWDTVPRFVLDEDLAFVASEFAAAQAAGEPPPLGDADVLGALGRIREKADRGQTIYSGEIRRRTVVGADATYALDPFVLKLDIAYTRRRTLYDQNARPQSLPWVNAVAGVEYYWGDRLQIFVEAFVTIARQVPGNVRLAYFEAAAPPPSASPGDQRDVMLPGFVAVFVYNALEGDLRVEIGAVSTLGRGDFAISPSVTWRVDDHHRLTIGGFALEGRADGIGGAYTNTDQLFLAYRFAY